MGRPVAGVVVALGAAAVLVLAGCSDEQGPTVDEPVESSSSDPTAPTSSAAAEPQPWEEKSKAGALAFAERWVVLFNEAQISGDTAALSSASSAGCDSCQGYVTQIDELYSQGGRLESRGWRVLEVGNPPGQVADRLEIPLRVNRTAQRVFSSDGKVERFSGAGKQTMIAEVVWTDGVWSMGSLDVLG